MSPVKLLPYLKTKLKKYLSNDILIYQMGKVGSSSIESKIPNALQVHDFYYTPPCYVHRKLAYNSLMKYMLHRLSLFSKRNLYRLTHPKIKIITVIRDPFERNISMFFQALPYWIIEYEVGISSSGTGVGARIETPDFLNNCYNEVFPHNYPLEWLDKELKLYTGIDVYDHEYDPNIGYMEINQGRYSVLLIEMKKIDDLTTVIEKFTGKQPSTRIPDSNKSIKRNSASQKWYSSLYRDFKNDHKLKDKHMSSINNSRYYNKFYNTK